MIPGVAWMPGNPLDARPPSEFVFLVCEEEPPELVRLEGRERCWSLGSPAERGRPRLRSSLIRSGVRPKLEK